MSPEKRGGIQPEKPRKRTGFKEVALGLALAAGLGAAAESGKIGVKKASAEDGNKDEVAEKSTAEIKSENDIKWQGKKYTLDSEIPNQNADQVLSDEEIKGDVVSASLETATTYLNAHDFELVAREEVNGVLICDIYDAEELKKSEGKPVEALMKLRINPDGSYSLDAVKEGDREFTTTNVKDLREEIGDKIIKKTNLGSEVTQYSKIVEATAENMADLEKKRAEMFGEDAKD